MLQTSLSLPNLPSFNQYLRSRLTWTDELRAGVFDLSEATAQADALYTCLSQSDRNYIDTVTAPNRRAIRIVQLALRRLLLNEWASIPLSDIDFEYGEHGKPFLPQYPSIHFSISHTDHYWAIAISKNLPVGLDIESIDRSCNMTALANRLFHPKELAQFNTLTGSEKTAYFYTVWTHKEAYGKATGKGFQIGFNHLNHTDFPTQSGQWQNIVWCISRPMLE